MHQPPTRANPGHGAPPTVAVPRQRAANWLCCFLVAALGPAAAPTPAAIYTINQSGGVQGTAVNATAVIGAGTASAISVNLTNGTQTMLGGLGSGFIDAGQYNDGITMYLNNSGILQLVNNTSGNGAGTFNATGASAVSSAVAVGGVKYAVIAGTNSGVNLLNLSNGALTPLPKLTNVVTYMTGLDVFLRPGGSTLNDLAIGVLDYGTGDPELHIFYPNGTLADVLYPDSTHGIINDLSFDLANGKIWFGTQGSANQGKIFDEAYDFSGLAVSLPVVGAAVSNGVVVVNWTGRQLWAAPALTNWAVVATAPATANQIFPPAAYVAPATNRARFFRASW